jgi:peptide/nickel transport system ATP-binding protein
MSSEALLEVDNLRVSFATEEGVVQAVDGVSFSVDRGEVVAIVGESGSGKSVTVMTLMGLTRGPNARFEGTARFGGRDLVTAPDAELQKVRGAQIAMIFQDPISSLDPVYRIGTQIIEQIRVHDRNVSKAEAMDRASQLMERVGIPRATERLRSYPHEFSGGMRQRVMIAMALSCSPKLLIADEPTTALDVTIQAQILELMRDLKNRIGTAIMLITHDLGVIAEVADRVCVMYAGNIVEVAPVKDLYQHPLHPYSQGLLSSIPRMDQPDKHLESIPGSVPNLIYPPTGCRFHPRCPHAMPVCKESRPPMTVEGEGHLVACYLYHGPVWKG